MAAALPIPFNPPPPRLPNQPNHLEIIEIAGVFRGHELTRKDRCLSSGILPLDRLLAGGIARGRISEITGPNGGGKTTIAAAFAAQASHHGETVGWIDTDGSFDPRSIEAAGADLSRILWAAVSPGPSRRSSETWNRRARSGYAPALKAAELLLDAGGFGLVVIDFGAMRYPLTQSAALRLARAAERSGAAVLVLAQYRMCGTFAALTLTAARSRACFTRIAPGAPALFDGIRIDASVARNKLGVFGHRANLFAATDSSTPMDFPFGSDSPFPKGEGGQGVRSYLRSRTSPLTPLPSGEGDTNYESWSAEARRISGEDAGDVEDLAGNAAFN